MPKQLFCLVALTKHCFLQQNNKEKKSGKEEKAAINKTNVTTSEGLSTKEQKNI